MKERGRKSEDDQIDYDHREFCVVLTQSKGSNFPIYVVGYIAHERDFLARHYEQVEFALPHNVTKRSCENVLANVVAKKEKEKRKKEKKKKISGKETKRWQFNSFEGGYRVSFLPLVS